MSQPESVIWLQQNAHFTFRSHGRATGRSVLSSRKNCVSLQQFAHFDLPVPSGVDRKSFRSMQKQAFRPKERTLCHPDAMEMEQREVHPLQEALFSFRVLFRLFGQSLADGFGNLCGSRGDSKIKVLSASIC